MDSKKKVADKTTNRPNEEKESEVMELGTVSQETRGSNFGHNFDVGFGVKPPFS